MITEALLCISIGLTTVQLAYVYWALKVLPKRFEEGFEEAFSPAVKRAFGILGKHSGDSRAQEALKEDLSEGALQAVFQAQPLIKHGLDLLAPKWEQEYNAGDVLAVLQNPQVQSFLSNLLKGIAASAEKGSPPTW